MVKCLECGFEGPRLQWTHFKYNCTGRFANGKEYKLVYPDAQIVCPSVAKSTAITLNNLIKKYGEVEGHTRWESYKQKQSHSNSFEYKKEKYGWAESDFNEFNSSRAQTLEKMISRYGETAGAEKWESYCLRQAYTNTKDYFVSKYGIIEGMKKYLEINLKKSIPHTPHLLAAQLGITIDDAVRIICNRNRTHYSGMEMEFVNLLTESIGELDHTSLKNPFGKWSDLLNSYVIYDIKHKNSIIEFNGDYWHANPKIYADTAIIRGKLAVDIRNRDMLKLRTATDLGFSVLTVWENEFMSDKTSTINKVIKWISNEQQSKV